MHPSRPDRSGWTLRFMEAGRFGMVPAGVFQSKKFEAAGAIEARDRFVQRGMRKSLQDPKWTVQTSKVQRAGLAHQKNHFPQVLIIFPAGNRW